MSFESAPKEEQAKQTENKDTASINRREFLKKAGKFFGGALFAGSAMEQLSAAKKEYETIKNAFSEEKLKDEIKKIQTEFPTQWEQELKRRISQGIEAYEQYVKQIKTKSKLPNGKIAPRGLIGFMGGSLAGLVITSIRENMRKNEPAAENKSDMEVITDLFNQIFTAGGLGAGGEIIFKEVENALKKQDPVEKDDKFKLAAQNLALKTLELNIKQGESSTPEEEAAKIEFNMEIKKRIMHYNEFIIKELRTKNFLEQWGVGSVIALAELAPVKTTAASKKQE